MARINRSLRLTPIAAIVTAAGVSLASAPAHGAERICAWTKKQLERGGIDPEDFCEIQFQDLARDGKTYSAAMGWGTKNCKILNESSEPQPCIVFKSCTPPYGSSRALSRTKLRVKCYEASKEGERQVDLGCVSNTRMSDNHICWTLTCDGRKPKAIILEGKAESEDEPKTKTCALPKWVHGEG